MSLTVTNIETLKTSKDKMISAKKSYDDALKTLNHTVKSTMIFWQGKNADDFRAEVDSIIKNELDAESKELELEINYLNKITTVLENAEDQVQKRLNA